MKLPDFWSSGWWNRTTLMASFDQVTDTRISGLYLNQMRFLLGYSLSDDFQFGVTYVQPTNVDNDVLVQFAAFPGFTAPMQVRISESVKGYVAWRLGNAQFAAQLGHLAISDELTAGLGVRVLHNNRLASFVSADYGDKKGTWTGTAGIELKFGPGTLGSTGRRRSFIASSENGSVIRGQRPGAIRFASLPQGIGSPQQDAYPFDQLNLRQTGVGTTAATSPLGYGDSVYSSLAYPLIFHGGINLIQDTGQVVRTNNLTLVGRDDATMQGTTVGVEVNRR